MYLACMIFSEVRRNQDTSFATAARALVPKKIKTRRCGASVSCPARAEHSTDDLQFSGPSCPVHGSTYCLTVSNSFIMKDIFYRMR